MDLIKKIDWMQREIADLRVVVEGRSKRSELQKKFDYFRPKFNENYWFVAVASKSAHQETWVNTSVDTHRLSVGNVFGSRADAQYHSDMVKLSSKIRSYSMLPDRVVARLKKGESVWFMALHVPSMKVNVFSSNASIQGFTGFGTKEIANHALGDAAFEDVSYMVMRGLL